MAPELYDDSIDDLSKVDTFAAAVVLINLLTGCKFVELDKQHISDLFSDKELCNLLQEMLQPDVQKRISLSEVLNQNWVKNGMKSSEEEIKIEMKRRQI